MDKKIKAVLITGPTACGKTALAAALAKRFNGEIISVDSRQVYRGMDLGSGKDLSEYGSVPYHLIDVADPGTEMYSLGRFLPDAYRCAGEAAGRGKNVFFCGGTALYAAALLRDYRLPGGELPPRNSGLPRERQNPDAEHSFRPPFELEFLNIGVYFPRESVRRRIEERLDSRFAAGMTEEVQNLHGKAGVPWEKLEFFGLEYREIALFLQGKQDFDTMRTQLLNKIRQFAKRQDIFFRKLEREGIRIHWLAGETPPGGRTLFDEAAELTELFLNGHELPEVKFSMKDIYYGKRSSDPAAH